MTDWHDYHAVFPAHEGQTVTGTVKVAEAIYSPELDNQRPILVYLPPDYDTSARRYPVLYMHDGQNLFDAATSFSGEWQVDETMQALSAGGLPAIVVGVPNLDGEVTGARLDEYGPTYNAQLERGGQGDAYLAFLCETLKPLIDADFRTRREHTHTGIMGSSMGGLISLYAFFTRPGVFGLAGVMSPAFWFMGDAIFDAVHTASTVPGRIYMDVGTAELDHIPPDERRTGVTSAVYLNDARRMRDLLVAKGYQPGSDLLYIEDAGAPHHESAWARRLPDALRFLLAR